MMKMKIPNIHIGDTFTDWLVISKPFKNKYKNWVVNCKCLLCGKEHVVRVNDLLSGRSKGCQSCRTKKIKRTHRTVSIKPGDKFGKLTVLREEDLIIKGNRFNQRHVVCLCECGNMVTVRLSKLKSGHTKSCGCSRHLSTKSVEWKHLKRVWSGMKSRCYCPSCSSYPSYGAKGTKICNEWKNDFTAFYNWSISNGYKYEPASNGINKWTIDRIDVNGDYCPENCRWVTWDIQFENRPNCKKKVDN